MLDRGFGCRQVLIILNTFEVGWFMDSTPTFLLSFFFFIFILAWNKEIKEIRCNNIIIHFMDLFKVGEYFENYIIWYKTKLSFKISLRYFELLVLIKISSLLKYAKMYCQIDLKWCIFFSQFFAWTSMYFNNSNNNKNNSTFLTKISYFYPQNFLPFHIFQSFFPIPTIPSHPSK